MIATNRGYTLPGGGMFSRHRVGRFPSLTTAAWLVAKFLFTLYTRQDYMLNIDQVATHKSRVKCQVIGPLAHSSSNQP